MASLLDSIFINWKVFIPDLDSIDSDVNESRASGGFDDSFY